MNNVDDFVMYVSLLTLYIRDRESNLLDQVPKMVLEHYLHYAFASMISEKFNVSKEEIVELSKYKIKSGKAAEFLLEHAKSIMDS